LIQFNAFDHFYQVMKGYNTDFEILIHNKNGGLHDKIIGELPEDFVGIREEQKQNGQTLKLRLAQLYRQCWKCFERRHRSVSRQGSDSKRTPFPPDFYLRPLKWIQKLH
jgi:hypothetical protein